MSAWQRLQVSEVMKKFEAAAGLAQALPFDVNVWRAQNNYYALLQKLYPERLESAMQGKGHAREWVEHFIQLGLNLAVKVEMPAMPELAAAS